MAEEEKKTCFVIAPIGDEESDIRERSDQVLNHIIVPAVKECGYEAVRADKISEPGLITSQVIQHLLDDPLVVADLTGHNPNVFYELAVRHAVRKPCVQIIQTKETIPFDVAQSRTIQVDYRNLDSAARCRDSLIEQIRSVEKNPLDVDTPISVAVDLQSLRQSKNPLEKSNAEIISILLEVYKKVAILEPQSSVSQWQYLGSLNTIMGMLNFIETLLDYEEGQTMDNKTLVEARDGVMKLKKLVSYYLDTMESSSDDWSTLSVIGSKFK